MPFLYIIGGGAVAGGFGNMAGAIIAGERNIDNILSAGMNGAISGAIAGATAIGSIYFGAPTTALVVVAEIISNISLSVMDSVNTVGKEGIQGQKDYIQKTRIKKKAEPESEFMCQ